MSDFLLDLDPRVKKIVKSSGIPIPMPQKLERESGRIKDLPLSGSDFLLAGIGNKLSMKKLPDFLSELGAGLEYFDSNTPLDDSKKYSCLLFDASDYDAIDDLSEVYDFFHKTVRRLSKNGRVIVLTEEKQGSKKTAVGQAIVGALRGFVKSIAKEVGKKGSTANIIISSAGSSESILETISFLASKRSAFISGQLFELSKPVSKTRAKNYWNGKTALITGAARGIGLEICRAFKAQGVRVIGLDRPDDREVLDQAMAEIGGEALYCDLSESKAALSIRMHLEKANTKLDFLINNAGVTRDKTLANMDQQRWGLCIDVNLRAVISLCETLFPAMLSENAKILCMASISGIAGNFGQTNYSAAKSGLIHFTEAFSEETKEKGISINAIAPGFIETRMTAAMPVFAREAARRVAALGQGGLPIDIANAALFLCGPAASSISGKTLRVCGSNMVGT